MSTRAIVNFYDSAGESATRDEKGRFAPKKYLRAKVYRHCDGYPEGLGKDLKKFLALLKKTVKDNRFNDASYLAAKWVVHDSERFAVEYHWDREENEPLTTPKENRLDFLSVGIMMEDPGDIEYIYDVVCVSGFSNKNAELPKITHKKA